MSVKTFDVHKWMLANNLRSKAQEKIQESVEKLEQGVYEGVFIMHPPTDEEYEAYFIAELNVYFELWASTWSM